MPCNEMRLLSVPELGYRTTDTNHGVRLASSFSSIDVYNSNSNPNPNPLQDLACFGRGEVCYRYSSINFLFAIAHILTGGIIYSKAISEIPRKRQR
jgi:hypothetical protein